MNSEFLVETISGAIYRVNFSVNGFFSKKTTGKIFQLKKQKFDIGSREGKIVCFDKKVGEKYSPIDFDLKNFLVGNCIEYNCEKGLAKTSPIAKIYKRIN